MKILAFSLSLRQSSLNKKLVEHALKFVPDNIQKEIINLKDYEIPAYNGDIEMSQGLPKNALALHQKMQESDAIIIASPEYNFSYPGHFKNTFDWLSRAQPIPWMKKAVLLLSASPSQMGANRGLWHLRVPFEACGAFVYPDMFSLAIADKAFDSNDNLQDANMHGRLKSTVEAFVDFSQRLQP